MGLYIGSGTCRHVSKSAMSLVFMRCPVCLAVRYSLTQWVHACWVSM